MPSRAGGRCRHPGTAHRGLGHLAFALNGVIFVLLGEQLPTIVRGAADTLRAAEGSPWLLVVHIGVVTAALVVLRFIWVRVSFGLRRRGHLPSSPRTPS